MWTPTTRKQGSRDAALYQTGMTDEEWYLIEVYLPMANSTGRRLAWPMHEIINCIFAGKKINGSKRHALVHTDGRGLVLEPHPASIQNSDGGGLVLSASRRIFPFIQRFFAEGGYASETIVKATLNVVKVVNKIPNQTGLAGQPRRWLVERLFAWIARNRRLARDFETTIDSALAFLYADSVMPLMRRIARAS